MKTLKVKVLAVLMVLVIAIAPMTALAATGVNANEQAILDAAKAAIAEYTLNPSQLAKANSMVAQMETAFKGDIEVTDAQKTTVLGQIATMKAAVPTKDLSAMSIADLYKNTPAIATAVSSIATALGVSIDVSTGGITITQNGKPIVKPDEPVKPTGVQVEYLVFAGIGFAALIAACVVVAKKKNLFTAA